MSILLPQRPPQENLLQHTFDLYGDDIVNGVVPSSVGDKSRLPQSGRGYNITDPTSLLRFTDLTGITITAFEGTTTPTINGNDINLSTGKLYSLTLSNGAFFNCEDTGLIAFNSAFAGFNATKINTDVLGANTFSYESVDAPEPYMNKVGYSDGDGSNNNGLYIPRNESNPKFDVLGNPLQYKSQVSYPAKLVESNCLSFNGVDGYVDFGNTSAYNLERTNSFSICFWFKYSGLRRRIFCKRIDGGVFRGYEIVTTDSGEIVFVLCSDNSTLNQIAVVSPDGYNDDNWHFLVATYNGSSSASGINLFIDGVQVSKTTLSDNLTGNISNNASTQLGKRDTGTFSMFNGQLAEVKLINRDISFDEVKYLFNGNEKIEGRLISSPCSEGSGNTIFNKNINESNGTLINGVSWTTQNVYHYNHSQGYSLYQHNTDTVANPDIRVPLGINPVITNYTKIKDVRPSQRNHNGAETKVDFNPYGAPEFKELGIKELKQSVTNTFYQSLVKKGESLYYSNTLNYLRNINYLGYSYEPETITYKNRVKADGGKVIDLAYVDLCYKEIKNKNVTVDYSWLSASFGVKKDVNNKVSVLYSLGGSQFDLVQNKGSKQPTWVENGIAGLPEILPDGVDDYLISITGTVYQQPNTFITLIKNNNTSVTQNYFNQKTVGNDTKRNVLGIASGSYFFFSGDLVNIKLSTLNPNIFELLFNSPNSKAFSQGVLKSQNSNTESEPINYLALFTNASNTSNFSSASLSDLLFINEDRADLSFTNFINNRYNIF